MSSAADVRAERDDMTRVYALVVVCHAVVIFGLWLFGRIFSN